MRRRKRAVINNNMRSRVNTNTAGLAPLTGKSGLLHNCVKTLTYNSLLAIKPQKVIKQKALYILYIKDFYIFNK